jgi:hypothetical protein
MLANPKLIFPSLAFIFSVALIGCNLRCLTVPSCWVAPGPTTKISTNKYYKKRFIKTDSLLSTQHIYEVTDTINPEVNNGHKYQNRSFLFYSNGLVLEQEYYTDNPNQDTIHTYTQDLKFACCHAWTIGSYNLSNDTVNFATKSGEMKYWQYYKAKVFDNSIQIFEEIQGDKKKNFPKRVDKVIIKDIKFR